MSDSDEDFQQLQANDYDKNCLNQEVIEVQQSSIRPMKNNKQSPKYKITISQFGKKTSNDINILQNQYYFVQLTKGQEVIVKELQRRFSDFDFLFDTLFKKHPGFIFPAFPQKGIFNYVRSKVTIVKDQNFLRQRVKMVQRFMNKILNDKNIFQQTSKERQKFFSKDDQFQRYKQTQKGKQNWDLMNSWNKLKGYFNFGGGIDNKYKQCQQRLASDKKCFQYLHSKVKLMQSLIKSQTQENQKFSSRQLSNLNKFQDLKVKLKQQNQKNNFYQKKISDLQFQLFCENSDYMMVFTALANRQEIRQSENSLKRMQQFERNFQKCIDSFWSIKKDQKQQIQKKFSKIMSDIQEQGCFK